MCAEKHADIPLTEIIEIKEPQKYKLHCASRNLQGVQPLDVYVRDEKEWREWNTWRSDRDHFSRQYIFSMMHFYHESNMWLFGGIYEVTGRGKNRSHSYEIRDMPEHSHFIGRLKIEMEKPRGEKRPARGKAFYLEGLIDKMKVSEILREPYSGESFPGFEEIDHDFGALLPIFRNEKPDWKAALENVKGVYVITDKSNGKRYIGSAYGDYGIWSRWSHYMETGHGGNAELAKLIAKNSPDYAQKHFKFSLLEYRSMRADDEDIHKRETYWKEVFLSRDKRFGYNEN